MNNPDQNQLISDVIDAFEDCYGGPLDVPDSFSHVVDTIAQHLQVDIDRIECVICELMHDRAVTLAS